MSKRSPSDWASLGLLAVLGVLIFWTVDDYGVSWDEYFRWQGGDAKLAYYQALLTGDFEQADKLRSGVDHYPGLFDLPLALARQVYSGPDYWLGHVWCAGFGLLGVAGAMALARRLGGVNAGLLAGVLLVLFPRYWGHLFINPKDIPFAATYVWGLWALAGALANKPRESRSALLFGALAGACMSVRIGGLLLFCYAGLFIVTDLIMSRLRMGRITFYRELWMNAYWLGLAILPAVAILLLFWPAAHQNPFSTTAGTVAEVTSFGWAGEVLFHGEPVPANELPRHYLLEMLARVTPDWWWALMLGAVVFLLTKVRRWRGLWARCDHLLVAFAVVFPLAYILVRGAVVYDGARHALFVIPPAAALLAAWTVSGMRAMKRRWGSWPGVAWGGAVFVLALASVWDMARLHPYQYTYYNRLTGGLADAAGQFETDYWGTAFREATEILASELPERAQPWRVTMEPPLEPLIERFGKPVVPPPALVEPFLGETLILVRGHQQPELYIASTRNGYDAMREGAPLLTVARDGAPLVVVKAIGIEINAAELPDAP